MERMNSLTPDYLYAERYDGPYAGKSKDAGRLTIVKNTGLCVTCDNARACTFSVNTPAPVMCCEEFDGAGASSGNGRAVSFHATDVSEKAGRPLGLCLNCGNGESCSFTKAEGGVWQCEEYE